LIWSKFIVPPQGMGFVSQYWQLPMLNQMVLKFATWSLSIITKVYGCSLFQGFLKDNNLGNGLSLN
jgi:hypothetical protein